MEKILLTAFEPFGGERINPSLEAARALENLHFEHARIEIAVLPVARFQAEALAIEQLRAAQPDVVLMLGQAGRRSQVTPERVAINVDDFPIPDNAGNQPRGEPIIPEGPVGYFSSLPIQAMVDELKKASIPAAISNTAGTYLCNRLFYRVMHCIAAEQLPIRAGFIHVPFLHEQTIDKSTDAPSLSRETIFEAVRILIDVSLRV
ncbi:MAG: pyroglutamyl-peptidase I [Armatimonadota bacterium]